MSPPQLPSVVHVLGRLEVGGAERMLLQVARRLVGEGHSGHAVVVLSGRSGSLSEAFAAVGVQELPCPIAPAPTFPLRLARTFRSRRPDVVVSHVSLASGLVLLVAWLVGVRRRVAVMHSDGDGRGVGAGRRAYRWLSRRLLSAVATDVVGVTASTLAFAGRGRARSSRVLPNAVDLGRFHVRERSAARVALGLDPADPVVLHVGRGAPEKNRVALAPCVAAAHPRATLVLCGAPSREDLGDVDERVRVVDVGVVEDVRPVLAAADVLLLPSVREGLPLVVLEALAAGRPVVVTDLPGTRSAFAEYPDVVLVRSDGRWSDYVEPVRRALASARRPEQIRATVHGSGHDLDRVVQDWRRLCRPRT